jgi:ribonuclease VapC
VKVYDASALLALLNGEPGADKVLAALAADEAAVASVNFAEVISKLIDRGVPQADAMTSWRALEVKVLPVDEPLALAAASLRPSTRVLGLSLGDRCCLALAASLEGTRIVTADRAWAKLKGWRFEFVR